MIYETKGLTLEQIDEMYAEVPSARKSVGWEPKITFRQRSIAMQGGQIPVGKEAQMGMREDKAENGGTYGEHD